MQAKDIPEAPVLRFIADKHDYRPATWFDYRHPVTGELPENSVLRAMPEGTPAKVALAKMRALIKRGLADGCSCGCRGDFELTDKGRDYLNSLING